MKIYVVSLYKSPRRKLIKSRADSLGLNIEFINAIEGNKLTTKKKLYLYDIKKCHERHKRNLSNNEIACFLSHIKTWKIISKNKYPCVVLEDDAILTPNFPNALSAIDYNSHCADIILLGHSKLEQRHEWYHYFKNPLHNKINFQGFSIGSVYKLWTSGAVGYWLTADAAKKLIVSNSTICCVADDWDYHQKNGLVVKELRPYVVREDYQHIPSSLEYERKKLSKYKKRLILEPARVGIALYRNFKSLLSS